jgi:hypothetical protein
MSLALALGIVVGVCPLSKRRNETSDGHKTFSETNDASVIKESCSFLLQSLFPVGVFLLQTSPVPSVWHYLLCGSRSLFWIGGGRRFATTLQFLP